MNNLPICIVSLRQRVTAPAYGCVMEMENVLAQSAGVPVVAPMGNENWFEALEQQGALAPHLMIAAISIDEVVVLLNEVKDWRRRFISVHAYVYDCWLTPWQASASPFKRRFSAWFRTVSQIDGFFVPSPTAADEFRRCLGTESFFVPLAADVLQFGTHRDDRAISVNGYGRQHARHIEILADSYNRTGTHRAIHHTDHMRIGSIANLQAHRAWFWKLLSMSQIALAYDLSRVDPDNRQLPFSIVGQRWFESLTAGCAVVGFRPKCAEAEKLLSWIDSTVECPEDPQEFYDFVEELLNDSSRLNRIRRSNFVNMACGHDWGHRCVEIFGQLKLEIPDLLVQRLEQLAGAAESSKR